MTEVVSVLLNDGVHAPSGARILKAETVKGIHKQNSSL